MIKCRLPIHSLPDRRLTHLRRYLPLGHPFCALLHEQDLHGGEDDLEIFEQAGTGDVHEIQQQLVVGGGVVLAVDLGVAGEAAFGLEPQVPLGHFFGVLGGNLGTFGPGSYNGHIPLEDVQQLGQFVEADGPDEPAHSRYPGIVLAGAEPGHAVFFGIHAHAAEFQHGEDLAVLRQPFLAVEDVAAVGVFDGRRHAYHDGREHHQGHQGQDDVEEPFEEQVFRAGIVALDGHHGQVEQVDLFSAVHDHVADAGDHVGADLMGHTVFGDDVPVVAVEAAAENHLGALQGIGQLGQGFVHGHHGLHVEVHIHAVLLHQGVHVLALAQDDHGLLGRKHMEVPLVGSHGPEHDEHKLQQERGHKGERADVHPVHQQGDQVHEDVADKGGQGLAVDQFVDAADMQGETVVQMGGEIVEQAKQEHHDQVAPMVERSPQLGFVKV